MHQRRIQRHNIPTDINLFDVSDSEEEMSVESDKTTATSNITSSPNTSGKDTYTTKHKMNNNIKIIANEKIDEIIKEFLANDKSELREINRLCSRITERLNHQQTCHMEDLLLKYQLRITKLETINDDCHQCIGELLEVNDNQRANTIPQMDLRREFLLNKNNGDGRKKIFQIEPATPQSTSSSVSNCDSSDRSEHKNNILGRGLCGSEINSLSDGFDDYSDGFDDYFDNELNSYDTDNSTDDEYE